MAMKGRVVSVINPSKRSGEGAKGAWNIMEVEVEKEDGAIVKADTFDTVSAGDVVTVEPNNYTNPTTGKTYEGWNVKIPKTYNFGAKPTGPDQAEVLQAIRMVFREIKEVKTLVEQLLENDTKLGVADVQAVAPGAQVVDMPEDFGTPGWANAPSVETHVEPMPDQPADLEDFMNAQ